MRTLPRTTVVVALVAALLQTGCGYYKRTDTGSSNSSSAGSASAESEAVDLTGVWALRVSGCEVGNDAWSTLVEIDHDVDSIALRFTHYQETLILVGIVSGQKLRADHTFEENDGTLTWTVFEASYHSGGKIISGEFTGRDGVTCTLTMVR